MTKEELILYLKNFIFKDNNNINDSKIVMINKERDFLKVKNLIFYYTQFIDYECRLLERIYCILNSLISIPTCKICDNKTKFHTFKNGYKIYCSKKCMYKDKDFWKKCENTYFEKTGYRKALQNPEVRKEKSKRYFEKTGYYHDSQNPEVQKKKETTCFNHYGVTNPYQIPKYKQKALNSILKLNEEGNWFNPNFNRYSIKFFKILDNLLKTKGFYGKEEFKYLLYSFDYFNQDLKLIIEWDEKHHFDKEGNLIEKDILRQKEIQEYFIDFKFLRIKESDFLINKKPKIIDYEKCLNYIINQL